MTDPRTQLEATFEPPRRSEPVSHAEASDILSRFINSHFRSRADGETARFTIPVDPGRDDDCLMDQYITEQCERDKKLAALEAENAALRGLEDIMRLAVDGGGLDQVGVCDALAAIDAARKEADADQQ